MSHRLRSRDGSVGAFLMLFTLSPLNAQPKPSQSPRLTDVYVVELGTDQSRLWELPPARVFQAEASRAFGIIASVERSTSDGTTLDIVCGAQRDGRGEADRYEVQSEGQLGWPSWRQLVGVYGEPMLPGWPPTRIRIECSAGKDTIRREVRIVPATMINTEIAEGVVVRTAVFSEDTSGTRASWESSSHFLEPVASTLRFIVLVLEVLEYPRADRSKVKLECEWRHAGFTGGVHHVEHSTPIWYGGLSRGWVKVGNLGWPAAGNYKPGPLAVKCTAPNGRSFSVATVLH